MTALARRGRLVLADAWSMTVAWLPVVLMGLLALGTWWLVRNAPVPESPAANTPARGEPDYTMDGFVVQRFGPDGRLRAQIAGERLRHFPDTDRLVVDAPRVRTVGEDGQVTVASARRATASGDGGELTLDGDARVERDGVAGEPPIVFAGQRLQASQAEGRIVAPQPVTVTRGATTLRADRAVYDHRARVLTLEGGVRAVLVPEPPAARGRPAPAR